MLNGHVLVLNKSWVAVHVTPVKRAMCLLYQGDARAVHPEDYTLHSFNEWCEIPHQDEDGRFIHTPNFKIRIPDVIILTMFNRFIRRKVSLNRRNIFERDRHKCQYCGKRFPRSILTLDHVIPHSRGGRDTWENLVLACSRCNVKKGNRTPREAGMPLLSKPIKPSWLPQFGVRVPASKLDSWRQFINDTYWDFGTSDFQE